MKKKISLLLVALILIAFMPQMTAQAKTVKATKKSQEIQVDWEMVKLDSYLIEGKNFVKLRDIAAIMNGRFCQFNVGYDKERNLVVVELMKAYEKLDGDLQEIKENTATAILAERSIIIDGEEHKVRSAMINGNNFIELRALSELVNFGVDYNAETELVTLYTQKE